MEILKIPFREHGRLFFGNTSWEGYFARILEVPNFILKAIPLSKRGKEPLHLYNWYNLVCKKAIE